MDVEMAERDEIGWIETRLELYITPLLLAAW